MGNDGYDYILYPDDEPPTPDCSCCDLVPIILEKVEWLESEFKELKGYTWRHDWNFELEPLFSQDKFYAKQGPGSGLLGLFHIIRDLQEFILDIHKDLAAKENYVATYESWQIPLEAHRPQLVVQSAELDINGNFGSAKYVTAIPYYREPSGTSIPPFTFIAKGSIKAPGFKEVVVYPKYARFYEKGIKEEFSWQVSYRRP